MLPDIMSCPRGSNIRPVRIQSWRARNSSRRSAIVAGIEPGTAARDHAHGVAAGVGVDAEEGVLGHGENNRR